MRAVVVENFGDPEGLRITELTEPEVGAGDLLIEVEAIGVGGVDAVIRRGTIGSSGVRKGHVLGSEVAGRVSAVGSDVDPSWIGARVWGFTGLGGGYAQRAVVAADDATRLPAALSAIDAVTLGSAATVAHFALAHARFAVGESVLVRGAAGSIGLIAVQLAAARGASAVGATTSSAERGERLRTFGVTHVLDRAGTPARQWDVVLDIVGGDALPDFLELLAPKGRLVSLGVVGGYPPPDFGMALMRGFQRSLTFSTFSLSTVPVTERGTARAELFEAAARDELQATVHDLLPLTEAANAHRRMDDGEVFGRIVLVP